MPDTNTKSAQNGKGSASGEISPTSTTKKKENEKHTNYANQQPVADPDEDETCATCLEKECWGTTGLKRSQQHRQKLPFKWIECDMCKSWFHSACQQLQVNDVTVITRLAKQDKGVKWYCDTCILSFDSTKVVADTAHMNKIHNLEQMITALGGKIEQYQNQTTEQVKRMEKSWAEVTSEGQMAKDVKKALNLTSSTQALLNKELDKKDKETRKNNVILYGLNETDATAIEQVKDFMKRELFKLMDQPEKAIRLGQRSNDSARPMKLQFLDEKAKWDFLKRVNSGSLREEHIFCKLDVDKQTRDQEYQLRQEIKSLRQTADETTEYRIRSLAIEKKTAESGEWKKVKPVRTDNKTTDV